MKYSELTRIQRKVVDALIELDETLVFSDVITRLRLEELFARAKAKNPKLGYPAFITRGRKVARAVYEWPGPQSTSFAEVSQAKSQEDIEFEESFHKEMVECGIM